MQKKYDDVIYVEKEGDNSYKGGGLYFELNSNHKTARVIYASVAEQFYIPSKVNYNGKLYKVTSIGSEAFMCLKRLNFVLIPESITGIGSCSFLGCDGLTSIYIPRSVNDIGLGAFEICRGLQRIDVEKNNPVYDSRCDCNAIIETSTNELIIGCKNTKIPDSVTSIGRYAFSQCLFASITIPDSVTKIKKGAFHNCTGLTSITIPNSVTSIESEVFENCTGLTSVNIPDSVTTIETYAFKDCPRLTSINIPNSVKCIGYGAFEGCIRLADVVCYALIPPTIDYDEFKSVPLESAKLLVPYEAVETYKAAEGWKKFGEIIPIHNDYEDFSEYDIRNVFGDEDECPKSVYDNPYFDDELDIDQQSQEFWDWFNL